MARWETWGRIPTYREGGLYALYESGALVYIGITGNLRSRLTDHSRRFNFDWIKVSLCKDRDERKWRERKLIQRLKPSKNQTIPKDVYSNGYAYRRRA